MSAETFEEWHQRTHGTPPNDDCLRYRCRHYFQQIGEVLAQPEPGEHGGLQTHLAHVHAWFLRECAAAPDSGEVVDAGAREAFGHLCHAMASVNARR